MEDELLNCYCPVLLLTGENISSLSHPYYQGCLTERKTESCTASLPQGQWIFYSLPNTGAEYKDADIHWKPTSCQKLHSS